MIRVKYDAVIGRETRFLYVPSYNLQAGFCSANHSAAFNPDNALVSSRPTGEHLPRYTFWQQRLSIRNKTIEFR
jgi:hypothetical protein